MFGRQTARYITMIVKIKKICNIYKNAGIVEAVYNVISRIREKKKKRQVKSEFFSIPEVTPLVPKNTDFKKRRLNLLVPSLEKGHVFGGISTALSLFEYMGKEYEYLRIIVTDTEVVDIDAERFRNYSVGNNAHSNPPKSILSMGDRYGKAIEVGEKDHFIATAWWTAYILQPILEWQQKTYGIEPFFYYFIQDYEPGFYSWSSRYAMADSTYKSRFKTKAILNTEILYHFFVHNGYSFHQQAFIDPPLNKFLASGVPLASTKIRKRPFKILVYGRPGVSRNCFEICTESLQKFVWRYENMHEWELYSVGEKHYDIELGKGRKLISLGKLPLDQYQEVLANSSVGLSLMVSPHPSYPPIEMAVYGLEVVTNKYANKNLSESFSNVVSLEKLTSDDVAYVLMDACRKVEERSGAPAKLKNSCLFDTSWEEAFRPVINIMKCE